MHLKTINKTQKIIALSPALGDKNKFNFPMFEAMTQQPVPANPVRRILAASLIGTTIEFFDFYIYATAAVLVFPKLFFSASDPALATLESLATFALAFFLHGHWVQRYSDISATVRAVRRHSLQR